MQLLRAQRFFISSNVAMPPMSAVSISRNGTVRNGTERRATTHNAGYRLGWKDLEAVFHQQHWPESCEGDEDGVGGEGGCNRRTEW